VTEALIPRRFWNHYEAARNGEAKTTCEIEQWHKTINALMAKYPRKIFWHVLSFFKQEIGE